MAKKNKPSVEQLRKEFRDIEKDLARVRTNLWKFLNHPSFRGEEPWLKPGDRKPKKR